MSYELAISTKRLAKTFNGKEVIRSCNMSVEKGAIYGFVGKKGSGKTTFIKMLIGLLKTTAGQATVMGLLSFMNTCLLLIILKYILAI